MTTQEQAKVTAEVERINAELRVIFAEVLTDESLRGLMAGMTVGLPPILAMPMPLQDAACRLLVLNEYERRFGLQPVDA